MVEAGGDQIPEETILEALELAQVEIVKICEALDSLREQVGKAKWVDLDLTAELEAAHGDAIRDAVAVHGLREASAAVDALVEEASPPVSMASTEDDMTKRGQIRASFASILEKARSSAVEGPVREQFLAELRELTDAEQDSKVLKSAKRDLLFTRILDEVELPFPVGSAPAEGEPAVKDSTTKQYVKRAAEAIYKDLVRKKIAVDKRRPDGRRRRRSGTSSATCR